MQTSSCFISRHRFLTQSNPVTVVLHCICKQYGLIQIAQNHVYLPESSTVIGLLLLLDFELSPFFTDVAFLQQKVTQMNKKYQDEGERKCSLDNVSMS